MCSLRVKDVITIVPGWHYAWQFRFAKIEPDATHRTCEATSGLGKFTCQMIGACVFLWYSSSGSEPVAITLSGTSGRASPGKQTDSLHGLQSLPPCGSQPRIIFRSFAPGPLWAQVLCKTHSMSKHRNSKRDISMAICLRRPVRAETPVVDGTKQTS
jgi:hypothetical protein